MALRKLMGALMALIALAGCGGEEPQPPGRFVLIVNHYVDFAPMVLNSSFAYDNEAGNQFKVAGFRYYLSGMRLHRADGGTHDVPMSADGQQGLYYIDEADADTRTMQFEGVPAGDYTAVSFWVGIDRSQVADPLGEGPLDPAKGLWNAQDGYLHLQFDGIWYERLAPPVVTAPFRVRLGDNHLARASVQFGGKVAEVRASRTPIVEINADAAALLNGGAGGSGMVPPVDFAQTPFLDDVQANAPLHGLFAQGFSFDHLHNE
jgi:hypothetical protein